jgi:hypothetical protein
MRYVERRCFVKQKEDNRDLYRRLDEERDRLTALLKEWPLARRREDQLGYVAALKAWRETCTFVEIP